MRAVLAEIERRRPTNPMIGLQVGSQETLQRVMQSMTDQRGIHAESLLAILGSLAGFACAASIGKRVMSEGKSPQHFGVVVATTKDGRDWWLGDGINAMLAESQYSVWSLVGGAAQNLGANPLFDPREVFAHVVGSIGSPGFGVPRLPAEHQPGDHPITYVRHLWPALAKIRDLFCRVPEEWPVLYGLAAQRAMEMAKNSIDPLLAARIVFECAVPMSKLNPLLPPPELDLAPKRASA
jgi:hypothetical protein